MTNFTKFLILILSLCAISCAEKEFTDSVSEALHQWLGLQPGAE